MTKIFTKAFTKFAIAGALLAGVLAPSVAKADSINGSISISGNDSYTSSAITFTGTSYVISSTIPGITGLNGGQVTTVSMAPSSGGVLTYSSAIGQTLFTTTYNGTTLSLVITMLTNSSITNTGALDLTGYGIFSETGYTNTMGSFSLTSSSSGNTTFQLNGTVPDFPPSAATPEPSSLLLLGTGLVGAAGMMMRRRRNGSAAAEVA